MNSTSKVIFALLAGVAAGAIAGILVAPESGEKSRKKLLKNAKKLNESMKKNFDELSVKSQKAIKEVSDSLHDFKKVAEDRVSKTMNN